MKNVPKMVQTIVIFGIAGFLTPAFAAEKKVEKVQYCISDMNQRSAMLAAQDWPSLDKRARSSLEECKDALDAENVSYVHMQIAISSNEMGNAQEGLAWAQSCINLHYQNASCHLDKAASLHSLHRHEEARSALERAVRLIRHNIQSANRELGRPLSPMDRELSEAKLAENQAHLELAQALDGQIP